MDHQDIRTLRILEEIDQHKAPSQRYLSSQLDISLGLVNSFLKRLAQKGYFKVTTIPKNRVKYILTPKGALEKSRLTYAYIQHSFQFYRNARKKLRDTLSQLDQQGIKKIAFYGTGELAEIAYLSLQETNLELLAIFDENAQKKNFLRFKVQQLNQLDGYPFEKMFVTKIGSEDTSIAKLIQHGVKREDILIFK